MDSLEMKKIAYDMVYNSFSNYVCSSSNLDNPKTLYVNNFVYGKYDGIKQLSLQCGILDETDITEINDSVIKKLHFGENLSNDGLMKAVVRFCNNDFTEGCCGFWKIKKSDNTDNWWDLFYDDQPVAFCHASGLSHDPNEDDEIYYIKRFEDISMSDSCFVRACDTIHTIMRDCDIHPLEKNQIIERNPRWDNSAVR